MIMQVMPGEKISVILSPPRHPHLRPRVLTPVLTFELTRRKTVDTTSDNAITIQTLEKDWDSYDATIYIDVHTATKTAVAASLSPLAPLVSLESTVSTLSRSANCASPYKQKRNLCQRPSNLIRGISPSTWCASFQMVCQHSNEYNICSYPSNLPTSMKTRFSTLCPRLL